jgi:hypothetical protein
MPLATQLGAKKEATFGTPVVVDRFFEYVSESIAPDARRIQGRGLRSSGLFQRADRFHPYVTGYDGSLSLEVLSKGFGFWLEHMLGTVGTAGPTDTTAYTHTATPATLVGKGFTAQVNRPFYPAGTTQAFTWSGGKVTEWSLGSDTEGVLMAELTCSFSTGTTGTGLATASYPTAAELLTWAGGAVTIGGTPVPCKSFSLKVANSLDTSILRMGQTGRSQPHESDFRKAEWEATVDFESLAQYNRVVSTTPAGSLAQIVAGWTAPTLIAGAAATYPSLTATMPKARFDKIENSVSGPGPIEAKLSGVLLVESADALSVAYVTGDTTP